MGEPNMNRKSWDSLSSSFSNLEISISQDSCYASDEVSVTSNVPSTAGTSVMSSSICTADPSQPLYPKGILKGPSAAHVEDAHSESGYASDASDYGYDALSEAADDDDEIVYEFSTWDNVSVLSDTCHDDHDDDEPIDGSFIAFESMVRFDTTVHYIEAPEFPEDENTDTEMTCHELMERARNSGSLMKAESSEAGLGGDGHTGPANDKLEEHTSDVIDLDKRIFVAYMNGAHGIADPKYKSQLRARMDDINLGRAPCPFAQPTSINGVYLDHVLNHVIGVFHNLLAQEEFDELVSISESKKAAEQPLSPGYIANRSRALLGKIEDLLSERLAEGHVEVGEDELNFLASGVAYALEQGSISAWN